jgi:hypothetical protein
MSAERERVTASVVAVLIAAYVLIGTLLAIGVARHGAEDPWIVRADIVAASPATPYRDFPLALMPLEALVIQVLGTGTGADGLAIRVLVVALAAGAVTALAVRRGWGDRAAVTFLLVALPLAPVVLLRLELVWLALAVWGAGSVRYRREVGAGVAFGLAFLGKLWPVVLVPVLLIGRRIRGLTAAAIVVAVGGLGWFLVGGAKAPMQALTSRDALGWAAESTVGSVVRLLSDTLPILEGGVLRVGIAPTWARGLLLLAIMAIETAIWWAAARDRDRDPFGATSVVAVAALLALAPVATSMHAIWLTPWIAVAFGGDRDERRAATFGTLIVAVSALVAIADPDDTGALVHAGALLRNLLLLVLVAGWLARPAARRDLLPATA